MIVLLENPSADCCEMIDRSWPKNAVTFFLGSKPTRIIITCDHYKDDYSAQTHIFFYYDKHIKTTMVLPYSECTHCKLYRGGL